MISAYRHTMLAALFAAACRAGPPTPGAAPAPALPARDVLAAWRARDSTFAQSATILGDRTIAVRPPVAPVEPLADPALAVTKRAPGGDWPIGTGGHWVSETDAAGVLSAPPVRRGTLPALRISTVPAGRSR